MFEIDPSKQSHVNTMGIHLNENALNAYENIDIPDFQDQFVANLRNKFKKKHAITSSDFICPLTGEHFIDPVIASNGWVYEREALDEYLIQHNYCLPDDDESEAKQIFIDENGDECNYAYHPFVLDLQTQFSFNNAVTAAVELVEKQHVFNKQFAETIHALGIIFCSAVRERNLGKLQNDFAPEVFLNFRNLPDADTIHADSPLHTAIRNLDGSLIDILLSSTDEFFSFTQPNKQGETAGQLLLRLFNTYTNLEIHIPETGLSKQSVIETINHIKTSINRISNNGYTELHRQIFNIQQIQSNGGYKLSNDVYQEDLNRFRETILMINKNLINQEDNNEETALGFAVRNGLDDVVGILLENGAGQANYSCLNEIDMYLNEHETSPVIKERLSKMRQAHEKVDTQFKPLSFAVDLATKYSDDYSKMFRDVLNQYAHPPLFSWRHYCPEMSKLVEYFDARINSKDTLSYDACMKITKNAFDSIDARTANGAINRGGTLYGVYLKLTEMNPSLKSEQQAEISPVAASAPSLQTVYLGR
jgi:hypothetical protein